MKNIFTIFAALTIAAAFFITQAHAQNPTDAAAQFNRGVEYYKAGNYAEAVRWYRRAAEQGHEGVIMSLEIVGQ